MNLGEYDKARRHVKKVHRKSPKYEEAGRLKRCIRVVEKEDAGAYDVSRSRSPMQVEDILKADY